MDLRTGAPFQLAIEQARIEDSATRGRLWPTPDVDADPDVDGDPDLAQPTSPRLAVATTPDAVGTAEAAAAPTRLVTVAPFRADRRDRAKFGFTVRRVDPERMVTIVSGALRPRTGDLVLAVVEKIGQHGKIEYPSGRKSKLNVGDEIVVAYAHRYAPDQFEAEVPTDLGPAELVASGGVAARVVTKSAAVKSATRIRPVGLVGDAAGVPLNVRDFALPSPPVPRERPLVIAVVGTSMNSGKTTTIQYLVHGLHLAGRRPGATKVTGTGSGNDFWVMMDAGAHRMVDFTDAGWASTYKVPMPLVERTFVELVDHLAAADCGVILVEVADGIYQQETAALIDSPIFRSTVSAVIFAAGEALGAVKGVERLRELGLPVVAVSGKLTASPLAMRETAAAIDLPVLTIDQLEDPSIAAPFVEAIAAARETEPGRTGAEPAAPAPALPPDPLGGVRTARRSVADRSRFDAFVEHLRSDDDEDAEAGSALVRFDASVARLRSRGLVAVGPAEPLGHAPRPRAVAGDPETSDWTPRRVPWHD